MERSCLLKEEVELYDIFEQIEESVTAYINDKAYDKALEQFITLKGQLINSLTM